MPQADAIIATATTMPFNPVIFMPSPMMIVYFIFSYCFNRFEFGSQNAAHQPTALSVSKT